MSDQAPHYEIGQVINGHRWTGNVWEPMAAVALGAPTPPPSGPPARRAWYKRWWGIALLAFGALLLAGAVLGGGPEPDPVSGSNAGTAADGTGAARGAGIGDIVRDGQFAFKVTEVKAGVREVGSEFLSEKAQGAYTLVTMTVENIGDSPQTFFSDNISGTDTEGRELASDSTATIYANEDNDGWIGEINPGNSVEAIVAFDVAKGAALVAVEVHDSAFSGGATVRLR